jgi:Secretion system C-terminal sorting domain
MRSLSLLILLITLSSLLRIFGQDVVTFDSQNWNSDELLTTNFTVGNYSFTGNKPFSTNYGYNFDVNSISLYYVFQNVSTDKITIINSNDSHFGLISLAACQVSGISSDSLVIEGWVDSSLKYARSFANSSSWSTLTTNYNDVTKIVIRVNSISSQSLTDYNFDNITLNTNTLPVELATFEAQLDYKGIKLSWETATEINNYGFDIERENNNSDWQKIGFINGSGVSNVLKSYSYIDSTVKDGTNYSYRLKQIDNDGNYNYSTSIKIETKPLTLSYTLSQNYPNPFNPITTINYTLPTKDKVILKVYNITGSEITTLVNQEQYVGTYSIKFNGANLASGVYLYSLVTSSGAEVKKMILLK